MASDYVMKDINWANGPTFSNLYDAFTNIDHALDEGNGWVNALSYMIPGFGFARSLTDVADNLNEGRIGAAAADAGLAALSLIPGIGWAGSGLGKLAKAGAKAAKIGGRDAKGVGKILSNFADTQTTKQMAQATKGAAKAGKNADEVADAAKGFWHNVGDARQAGRVEKATNEAQKIEDAAVAARNKERLEAKEMFEKELGENWTKVKKHGEQAAKGDKSSINFPEGSAENTPAAVAEDLLALMDTYVKHGQPSPADSKQLSNLLGKTLERLAKEEKATQVPSKTVDPDFLQKVLGDFAGVQDYWSGVGAGGRFGRQLIRSLLLNDTNYGQQD